MSQTKNMWNYHANNTKYPKTEIEIEISVYIYIYFVLAKCEGFQISAEGCGCRMCPKTRRTTKLTRYLLSLSHLTFDGKCRENVWCCLFHLTFALVWTRRVPHDNTRTDNNKAHNARSIASCVCSFKYLNSLFPHCSFYSIFGSNSINVKYTEIIITLF